MTAALTRAASDSSVVSTTTTSASRRVGTCATSRTRRGSRWRDPTASTTSAGISERASRGISLWVVADFRQRASRSTDCQDTSTLAPAAPVGVNSRSISVRTSPVPDPNSTTDTGLPSCSAFWASRRAISVTMLAAAGSCTSSACGLSTGWPMMSVASKPPQSASASHVPVRRASAVRGACATSTSCTRLRHSSTNGTYCGSGVRDGVCWMPSVCVSRCSRAAAIICCGLGGWLVASCWARSASSVSSSLGAGSALNAVTWSTKRVKRWWRRCACIYSTG